MTVDLATAANGAKTAVQVAQSGTGQVVSDTHGCASEKVHGDPASSRHKVGATKNIWDSTEFAVRIFTRGGAPSPAAVYACPVDERTALSWCMCEGLGPQERAPSRRQTSK